MSNTLCYLDNAASEPLREEVVAHQQAVWKELGGIGANPSSSHAAGRRAAALLETARGQVARCLGADRAEVLFTGGGTESVALAVAGIAKAKYHSDRRFNQLWYSAVEHDSVRQAAQSLESGGISSYQLPVDSQGVVDLSSSWGNQKCETDSQGTNLPPAPSAIQTPPTSSKHSVPGLVSLMLVCNENGVIQPLEQVKQKLAGELEEMPELHTDAIQAVGRIQVDFHQLGISALSMAGHKIGGPASCGILVLKRGVELVTDRKGGGQERQIRGGTQDVIAASGLAKALELAEAERHALDGRHRILREKILCAIAQIEGVELASRAPAVPGIIQLLARDCEAEALLLAMDQSGVCVSAGSACHTGVARPSNVLLAQGYSEAVALGSIRVSFGWQTKESEVEQFLVAFPKAVAVARRLKQWKGQ